MKRRFTSIFRYLFSCTTVLLRGLICGRDTVARESLVARAPARGLTINLGFGCCFAAATLAAFGSAHAQSTDDSLRLYAVDIWQDPLQSWGPGRGVYLGKGLILTAAHVVGSAAHTKPSVRIAGMDLPARPIREGNFERVDLTLLSVDEQKLPIYLRMRRMPLCENHPWPAEPVIVAVPELTARSHVVSPAVLAPNIQRRFSTVISDVTPALNSGSGVFDAGQKCLLGIISRKIMRSNSAEAGIAAKYFVPASTIRAFIPTDYRF